jgi:Spy/CpxP family protein refolding chaperone
MRKRTLIIAAAAVFLLVNSIGFSAHAATTAPASAIPNSARNFTPIHQAACQGWGRWCPPGYVRACGPYRCWCRPCM